MNPEQALRQKFFEADDAALSKAIHALQRSTDGRTFLWWLINEVCCYGQDISLAADLAASAGRQSVLWRLLSEITARDPEGFITLQQEKLNEHRSRDHDLRAAVKRSNGRGDDAGTDDGEQGSFDL